MIDRERTNVGTGKVDAVEERRRVSKTAETETLSVLIAFCEGSAAFGKVRSREGIKSERVSYDYQSLAAKPRRSAAVPLMRSKHARQAASILQSIR